MCSHPIQKRMVIWGSGELDAEAVGLQSRAPSGGVAEGREGPGGEVKTPLSLPPWLCGRQRCQPGAGVSPSSGIEATHRPGHYRPAGGAEWAGRIDPERPPGVRSHFK